jgi:hypothetical protein
MKDQALEVFKIFERIHGESAAKTIIGYLVNADTMAIEKEIESRIQHLATKEDINLTREDINLTRNEIGNVRNEIANVRAELVKWMFVFWISQVVATFGFILLFIRK